mmetsp:Transcript_62608/g.167849  ORF Transcript_62608/g.167849 Transcript_62608/m.167849 type:complete len:80 (-) Transcript_62608:78-317(-)
MPNSFSMLSIQPSARLLALCFPSLPACPCSLLPAPPSLGSFIAPLLLHPSADAEGYTSATARRGSLSLRFSSSATPYTQ